MLTKLRRQIIAARFMPPDQPQPKKPWKSTSPGHKPPHNRESRVKRHSVQKVFRHDRPKQVPAARLMLSAELRRLSSDVHGGALDRQVGLVGGGPAGVPACPVAD